MGAVAPGEEASQRWSLDLPGVLPILMVAATWELLLKRVVGQVVQNAAGSTIYEFLQTLVSIGDFTENLSLLLALLLFGATVVDLLRRPSLGPIPHRVTIGGFATAIVMVAGVGWVVSIGVDTAVLANAAAVLLSLLVSVALLWHRIRLRLLIGVGLLLLPTLLRAYASLSISIALLRTETAISLYAFRAAEVVAVLTALVSPWLIGGLTSSELLKRPPLIAMGLASLPALAFAASLTGPNVQVQELCFRAVGFELWLPGAELVYPVALFMFSLTVALLVLPGLGRQRGYSEQRMGYAMSLLFLAGLDGLWGTVSGLGFEPDNVPELIKFLLEGNWSDLTLEQQALVGPPLRDLYQVVLTAFGYVLLMRGIMDGSPSEIGDEPDEGNGSEVS